jgi:methylmalonyl-CoA/ethylmalonyl-CoA epimerase
VRIVSEKYFGNVYLDHIGIACEDLEAASRFWRLLGMTQGERDEVVESQGVETRFFSTTRTSTGDREVRVELLRPTSADTPIGKFIASRGVGVQQICFRVDDLESVLAHLKNNDVRLINEHPVTGADNSLIAFVHPKSTGGVLVELTQRLD